MNKNTFFIVVIVGLLISNGFLLFFMTQKGPHRGPKHSPKEIVSKRLNFDEKQIADYEVLIKEHSRSAAELMSQVQGARETLYGQISETNNADVINKRLEPIAVNLTELEKLNFSHFQDIKALCKPDQLERFEELTNDLAKIFGKRKPPARR